MREVDSRVVEMRFDNQQFERGVQNSLHSIEKLKQGLDLEGSAKSLTNLEKVANSFSLGNIANGVEHISKQFSAFHVVAATALMNVTNAAMRTGNAISKALITDPIKSGFQEYETQINAVQTILANTSSKGTTLNQVNAALNELNTYADKTIYNFTEMTRNIGTFTAAGVDLNTSVSAIKGIANLAAVSGSTSQQASTAMYQLSQALASGTVKLMDWNSVVNAGMGGQVFQDSLKETARVHGVAIDQMIKSEGSFRETLSEGWLTSEILTETLNKFTGDLSETQLKQMGYTKEQLVEILKLGEMANDAATKVKTFTQLIDTLKEAAQSGWSQSWKLIVGDFGEAKEVFTEISDVLGKMIGDSAEARNTLLSGGLSSGWDQLLGKGIDDEAGYIGTIKGVAKEHNIMVDDLIKSEGSFEATLKRGWLTSDIMAQSLEKLTAKTRGLSDEQLEALGYTRAQVNSLETLNESVKNGSVSLDEFAKKMTQVSGRENLIETLRNAFAGVMSIATPLSEAFKEIFTPMTGDQLYTITSQIKELTVKFKIGEETARNLKETFKGVFAVFHIGAQAIQALVSGVSSIIGYVLPATGGLLQLTGSIGGFFVSIDDAIEQSNTFGKAAETIGAVLKPVADGVKSAIGTITEAFSALGKAGAENLEQLSERFEGRVGFFQSVGGAFTTIFDGIVQAVEKVLPIFSTLGGLVSDAFKKLQESISSSLDGGNFSSVFDLINGGLFAGLLLGLRKFVDTLTDIASDGNLLSTITGILDGVKGSLEAYQSQLKASTLLKIAGAIAILAGALAVISMIDSDKLTSSLVAISVMFADLFGSMAIFEKIMSGGGILGMAKMTFAMIGLSTAVLILSGAMKQVAELDWGQIARGLTAIAGMSAILVASSLGISKASGPLIRGSIGLVIFAGAIRGLVGAVEQLSGLDPSDLTKGLVGVGVLMTELVLFMKASNLDGMGIMKGTGLVVLAVALNVLADAVQQFVTMNPEQLIKGLTAVGVVLGELALFSRLTGNAKNIISTAIGLTILGGAMMIFANAMGVIGLLPLEQIGKGLLGISGVLTAVTIAMNFMPKNMIATGLGLVAVAGAISILATALTTMGGMSLEQIGLGLLALSGSLGAIALAMKLMTSGLAGAAAMLVMAGALALFTPALMALSSLSLTEIGLGLLALVGVFAVVGAASFILAPLTPVLLALGVAISLLGAGCAAVGAGLMLFSTALAALAVSGTAGAAALVVMVTSLLGLIPLFLEQVGVGIVAFAGVIAQGAPAIGEAVTKVVLAIVTTLTTAVPAVAKGAGVLLQSLLEVIVEGIPQVVDAGMQLILGIVEGISENIQEIVVTAVQIITEFLDGVASQVPRVVQSAFDLIIAFVDGLAVAIDENLETLITSIASVATAIIEGLVNGLVNGVKDVADAAINLGKSALDSVATFLGIHSPSREFMKLGQYTVIGFIVGMASKGADLAKKSKEIFDENLLKPINESIEKTAKAMTYGGGALRIFARELIPVTTLLSDSTAVTKAAIAIKDYGKQLFEESEQYKKDTKALKEHKAELADLNAQYKKLEQDLSKSGTKKKTKEIQTELKKVAKSIEKTKKEIVEAETAIVDNTKNAFDQMRNTIRDSVKSTVDPLKASIDPQIDLFKKFGDETEVTAEEILTNMESQTTGIKQWNADLDQLAGQGIAVGLLEKLRVMGPAGANYVKAFLGMTEEEMGKANESFQTSADMTAETLIESFGESLKKAQKWAEDMETLATMGLSQGILEGLGKLGVDGADKVAAFMTMTPEQIATVNGQFAQCLTLPEGAADKVMAAFAFSGSDFSDKLTKPLKDATDINSEDGKLLTENATVMGATTTDGVAKGLVSKEEELKKASTGVGKTSLKALEENISEDKGKRLAWNICGGLVRGLQEGESVVSMQARELARKAYEAAKSELGIESPSKAFAELGMYSTKGFAQGLTAYSKESMGAAASVGAEALGGLKYSLRRIADVLNSDIDATPVIRPVMDLSDLRKGVAEIDGMFLMNQGLQLSRLQQEVRGISNGLGRGVAEEKGSNAIVQNGASVSFTQNNYSPKALSRIELYRQTQNQFSAMKGVMNSI